MRRIGMLIMIACGIAVGAAAQAILKTESPTRYVQVAVSEGRPSVEFPALIRVDSKWRGVLISIDVEVFRRVIATLDDAELR